MIESLTPEQESRFPEFVKKWTQICLSTDPIDKEASRNAINKVYRCGGLPPPKKIVWCGSPLSMCLTRHKEQPDSALVKGSISASVYASVSASVYASVSASVSASVWNSVRASVSASVWNSVRNSVRDSVWASVRNSFWVSVRASVWASVYGSHETHWLSFNDFFRETCGLKEQTEKLQGLFDLAMTTGWILPFKDICYASPRPNVLHVENNKLHCLNGPAVEYEDGFKVYAVEGISVDEWVIERPWEATVEQIEKEKNETIKRLMMIGRSVGWVKEKRVSQKFHC